MDFQEYINDKIARSKGKVNADIAERWTTRILTRRLMDLGERGAEQYLSDYGKGIAAPKCIGFAVQATLAGYPEMAMGFWKKAYTLETGSLAFDAPLTEIPMRSEGDGMRVLPQRPAYQGSLPEHLRPGQLVTMQPVDAPGSREFYIDNMMVWGQPKRDGNRLVINADSDEISYQSRSLKLRGAISPEIEYALQNAKAEHGPFVLDGELYYPDFQGGEHRTGAQAATFNIDNGHPEVHPFPRYAIFQALYAFGRDLTPMTMDHRLIRAEEIGNFLISRSPLSFEIVPTAVTRAEKQALSEKQKAEGREGEVWYAYVAPYTGGKNTKTYPVVRTKYITEFEGIVVGLTPTTAEGRLFGAAEIVYKGKSVGFVSSGFSREDMQKMMHLVQKAGYAVHVKIATQGWTENGQMMHPRFIEYA